jgi:hypothetical protein
MLHCVKLGAGVFLSAMNRALPVCLVLAVSLSAAPPASVFGTVQSVSGKILYVATGARVVTLSASDHMEVWKGKISHDFSTIEAGDELIAQAHTDLSGQLIADTVWLNIVNVSGVITRAAGPGFEMFTNPNADPQSAYRKENKTVELNPDTTFEASAREDLLAGRNVTVVGTRQRNGHILATRVTIYDGHRPVGRRK